MYRIGDNSIFDSVSSSAILFACFCVPFNVLRGGSRYLHCTFLAFGFPCCCRLIQKYYFRNECQARVPGFHQVSKREKTFAAQWFYCFRAFGNLMKPEARVFEETIQNYAVLSFSHFSLKWLVCVICCIQSAFIIFVSFCFYKLSNSGFRVAPPNLYSKSVMNLTADLK